ncbi:MAG: GspH/FimT family pseudopilin [Betaproteobacteria bacterium]|nr:GspH/FimT family pseudopilin [Betaproteobacteria bacterium]
MTRSQIRATGFSLIEIIVVLLLMGVISALIVVNIAPDDKKQVRMESEKLAGLFEQAAMEARVSGETIAWTSDGNGYFFQEKSPDSDWTAMNNDIYRPHQLPKNITIQTAAIDQAGLTSGGQLIFSASGINPPFDMVMTKQQIQMRISGDAMNRVSVEPYHLGQ